MWTDHETSADYLDHSKTADRIVRVLGKPALFPLSIGVLGGWGSGKSTIFRLIEERLKSGPSKDDFLVVRFDAWRAEGFDEIRAALLEAIASQLQSIQPKESKIDKVKGILGRINYLRAISFITQIGATAISAMPILTGPGGLADGSLHDFLQDAGEATGSAGDVFDPRNRRSGSMSVQQISDDIEGLLSDAGKYLIVFIDNVDRCSPNNAIHVLEVVKNIIFLPRTAFIFALDETIIRSAVKAHYNLHDDDTVNDYIDKFIQISFRIRPLSIAAVRGYLVGLFLETKSGFDTNIVEIVGDLYRDNPQLLLNEDRLAAFLVERLSLSKSDAAELRAFLYLSQLLASAPGINGNPRTIKRILNTAELNANLEVGTELGVLFRGLIKVIAFERAASHSAFSALLRMLSKEDPKGLEQLSSLEEQAERGGFSTELVPYDWRNIDPGFLDRWLRLPPQLSRMEADIVALGIIPEVPDAFRADVTSCMNDLSAIITTLGVAQQMSTKILLQSYATDVLEACSLECIRILLQNHDAPEQATFLSILVAIAIHGRGTKGAPVQFLRSDQGRNLLARLSSSPEALGV